MQIEVVQCLVRLTQNGNTSLTQIPKAGPDAIPVTEIPILRMINDINEGGGDDECCVTRAKVVRKIEVTKANELARLRQKYGKIVDACYPGGRGLPLTLVDCEIPGHMPEFPPREEKPEKPEKADAGKTAKAGA